MPAMSAAIALAPWLVTTQRRAAITIQVGKKLVTRKLMAVQCSVLLARTYATIRSRVDMLMMLAMSAAIAHALWLATTQKHTAMTQLARKLAFPKLMAVQWSVPHTRTCATVHQLVRIAKRTTSAVIIHARWLALGRSTDAQ